MDKRSSILEITKAINLTEYEKAIDLLLKEIKYSGPKNNLLVLLADTYIKISDFNNAIKIYENLFYSDKTNPIYLFRYIELKIILKQYKEAKDLLTQISGKNKEDWQYYFLYGKLNYENKNFDNAINLLKESYKRNPKNIDILLLLADISLYINKTSDALRYYLAILKIDRNNAKTYENLGFLYYKLNKKKESYKAFEKANKLKPNSPSILKMLGLFEIEEGAYKNALKSLEKAYNLDPKSIDITVFLGYTYEKMNIFEQAEQLYYQAATLSKQNPEPYLHLAQLYQKQDLSEKTLQVLNEAENKFPGNEKIKIEIGKAALQLKDYQKAKKCFKDVLKNNTESEDALFGLGFCAELEGNLNEANNYYSSILELNPENEQTLLRKGIVEFTLGEKSASQFYLNKLLEKDPNNVDANIILGQIKLEDNQLIDALFHFENVKKNNSKNLQPYLILGEYYKKNNQLKEAIEEYSTILNLSRYKSIESIEQFNDILNNYETILSEYETEIKNRNLAVISKFKEKNIESSTISDEQRRHIESSIESLFDQVDETIGTKIDEIDNEDIEYNLISKILDGEFTEETESVEKDESSKILDYLSDGVFAPEEIEEKAEEIIEKKQKTADSDSLIKPEDEKETDIFEKIPFDNLQNKKYIPPEQQRKISDDEDISLLSEFKKDNIPASLDEAYRLNELEREKYEKEKKKKAENLFSQQPFQYQQPIVQPQIISPPYYPQQPIPNQMPYYPYQQPQPILPQNPNQQRQQGFPAQYSPPPNAEIQKPEYLPIHAQKPQTSFSQESMPSDLSSDYNEYQEKPAIPEYPINYETPKYEYPHYPETMEPDKTQFPYDEKDIPATQDAEQKHESKAMKSEMEDELMEDNGDIPQFPFDNLDEENISKDQEPQIAPEPQKEEETKQDNIPDYFEPIESIFPEKLTQDIPIEHPLELEEDIMPKAGKNPEKEDKGLVNLGVLKFGAPRKEIVKELLQTKPKSAIEKKEFISKSIKELGKYLFSEISTLPKDLQEKATLSENFQIFVKFMKKENNNA